MMLNLGCWNYYNIYIMENMMFDIGCNKPIILLWNGKLVYIVVNITFFFKENNNKLSTA